MKRQRMYISGPITGRDDFKERFAEAADIVRNAGYKPVNPTTMFGWFQFVFEKFPYRLQVLIDCLVLAFTCDAIYLMADYKFSRGATLDKAVADFCKMTVIEARMPSDSSVEDSPVVKAIGDLGRAMAKLKV